MRKTIWIWALMLCGPLFGETIGDLQFEFPPSSAPWVPLLSEEVFTFDEDDEDDGFLMNIFTHKNEEALEIFIAISDIEDEEEAAFEEPSTTEGYQQHINEIITDFFPNHRYRIQSYAKEDDGKFIQWTFNDGTFDLAHGLTRSIEVGGKIYLIGYFSTQEQTEENTEAWKSIMQQAHILN